MNQSRMKRFSKHVLAGVVLIIAALIVLKIIIGVVTALFIALLAIMVIVALVWAARVLF
jgi:hypothetical protein